MAKIEEVNVGRRGDVLHRNNLRFRFLCVNGKPNVPVDMRVVLPVSTTFQTAFEYEQLAKASTIA
jgi:hypothetical protein